MAVTVVVVRVRVAAVVVVIIGSFHGISFLTDSTFTLV